jgi:hypothetical protein
MHCEINIKIKKNVVLEFKTFEIRRWCKSYLNMGRAVQLVEVLCQEKVVAGSISERYSKNFKWSNPSVRIQ